MTSPSADERAGLELVLLLASIGLLTFAAVVIVPFAAANPPCTPIACTYNGSGQLPAPFGIASGNITTTKASLGWTSASTYSQGYGLTNESVFFWGNSSLGSSGYCLKSPAFGHQVLNATLVFSVPAIAAPQPSSYHLTWNFTILSPQTSYCVELNEWNGPQYGNYSKGAVFTTAGGGSPGSSGPAGSGSSGTPAVNSSNLGGLFFPGAGGLPSSYALETYSVLFVVIAAVAIYLAGHHRGRRREN